MILRGDFGTALSYFDNAAKLDPKNEAIQERLEKLRDLQQMEETGNLDEQIVELAERKAQLDPHTRTSRDCPCAIF